MFRLSYMQVNATSGSAWLVIFTPRKNRVQKGVVKGLSPVAFIINHVGATNYHCESLTY